MANEYTRYAENDPRAKGRGVPPEIMAKLLAGETVPGWTVNYNRLDTPGGMGDGGGDAAGPSYGTTPVSFSYKDPAREWYSTYGTDGALMNEGNGNNALTPKDLATFAALVGGAYGLNGGAAAANGGASTGMSAAAGGNPAWLSAVPAENAVAITAAGNAMPAASSLLPSGIATVAPAAVGGGILDAIKGGASSLLGGAASGAGGMNWGDLLKTGVALYGVSQAAGNASDATSAAANVANGQIDLNKQALDWYKQVYADQAPDRAQTSALAKQVADAQIRGMNFATDNAIELANYNKATFRPVEQRIVKDAMGYDTGERRMSAAASAAADVDTSIASARQAQNRALGRAGIAPGSTKALALGEDMAVQQGVARGAAKTGAVRNVESMGHARMMDAASLGRNIPSQQATQQQIAQTGGNSAVSNSMAGLQAAQSGNGLMSQGYGAVTNGNAVAGNLYNSIANGQRADDNTMLSGIGNIAQYIGQRYGTRP